MLFTDNQSHSLIRKHFWGVDKDEGLTIKGFLGMSKLLSLKGKTSKTIIQESATIFLLLIRITV